MNAARSPYYPVFLNVAGKRCVVVGGGQVALRKVESLLERGADVTVVSPEICPELAALATDGKIHISRRAYGPGDLHGAFLAVASTDDRAANIQISDEASANNIIVNVVDDAELSSFIVPSVLERGDLVIAVSTSGKSPALARKIRAALESVFGQEYAALTALVEEVRQELKKAGRHIDAEKWQAALEMERLLDLLHNGKRVEARDRLVKNLTSTSGKGSDSDK